MIRRAAATVRSHRIGVLLVWTIAFCLVPASTLAAPAAFTSAKRHKQVHRVGGKVHRAWPYTGKAPRSALARWLARQVGPTKVKPCKRRVNGKLVSCHRAKAPHPGVTPAHLRAEVGIEGDASLASALASVAHPPALPFLPDPNR